MFERQNQDILADHYAKIRHNDDEDADAGQLDGEQQSDDDLFDVKKRIPADGDFDPDVVPQDSSAADYAKVVHIPGAKEGLVLDSKRREKMLKSKKQLLKLKGQGQKLVFDDDGNAHQLYELEDEDDFRARGEAEDQRRRFLEEEAERVKAADVEDKELVKEKRRAKKEKRRERERAEAEGMSDEEDDGGEGLELGDGDNEDAMANFLADAASVSGSESEEEEQPKKKQKKWFQRDMPEEEQGGRTIETMDDLEAEAARLLG